MLIDHEEVMMKLFFHVLTTLIFFIVLVYSTTTQCNDQMQLLNDVVPSHDITRSSAAVVETSSTKLILQITVDQLRGDLPQRFLARMGEGGFRYLLEQGVVFKDAHHAHANTETIVGHVTLATGAYPSTHGMVANVWFDRATGRRVYSV